MSILLSMLGWFRVSLLAQILAGAIAFLGIWKINNVYQRSVGEKRGITKVVTKSNKAAKSRDRKVRKIRKSINPSTAWKRLLTEYSDSN